jgi:hypothetical protein
MRQRLGRIRQVVLKTLMKPSLRLLAALSFSLLLTVILIGVVQRKPQGYMTNPNEEIISASKFFQIFPDKKKTSAVVDLGLYIDSLYDLDMSKLSF